MRFFLYLQCRLLISFQQCKRFLSCHGKLGTVSLLATCCCLVPCGSIKKCEQKQKRSKEEPLFKVTMAMLKVYRRSRKVFHFRFLSFSLLVSFLPSIFSSSLPPACCPIFSFIFFSFLYIFLSNFPRFFAFFLLLILQLPLFPPPILQLLSSLTYASIISLLLPSSFLYLPQS